MLLSFKLLILAVEQPAAALVVLVLSPVTLLPDQAQFFNNFNPVF